MFGCEGYGCEFGDERCEYGGGVECCVGCLGEGKRRGEDGAVEQVLRSEILVQRGL